MKKVTIIPGCITCGLCGALAPEIFEVTDIARVRPEAPVTQCIISVKKAIAECPVQVIQFSSKEDSVLP
jgi:ferredoxin